MFKEGGVSSESGIRSFCRNLCVFDVHSCNRVLGRKVEIKHVVSFACTKLDL